MAEKDKLYVMGTNRAGDVVGVRKGVDGGARLVALSERPNAGKSLVQLRHVESNEYDIESELTYNAPGASEGPPKVTSDAYRIGWDGIFGRKKTIGKA